MSIAHKPQIGEMNKMQCTKCGAANEPKNIFCTKCGTRLVSEPPTTQPVQSSQPTIQPPATISPAPVPTPPVPVVDEGVREFLVRRFEAIRNRHEAAVLELVDEGYSKFDDWAPYHRQNRGEALQNEFSAFKVLANYSYEIKDLQTVVLGDMALATFTLHYQAIMRRQQFGVTSRVTAVLKRQDSAWKLLHEHYSRYPQLEGGKGQQRRRFGF